MQLSKEVITVLIYQPKGVVTSKEGYEELRIERRGQGDEEN